MTDSMRDRIDRVIYDVWNLEKGDEIPYLSPEAREALIDALLAAFPILAEVTDEMVEAGAREVDPAAWDEQQWQTGGRRGVIPETEGAHAARSEARGIARAVLSAVLGTPGDVSTEHVRDHLSICTRCGEGLSGATIVDGETPCAGRGAS